MESIKYTLSEDRIPRAWYNIVPDLPRPLAPVLHPGTHKPVGPEDLAPLFPMAVITRIREATLAGHQDAASQCDHRYNRYAEQHQYAGKLIWHQNRLSNLSTSGFVSILTPGAGEM